MPTLAPLAPLIAFLLGRLVLNALLSERGRALLLDQPNERSLHARPVPRTGGLAIMAGSLAAAFWLRAPVPLVAGAAGLMAVSLVDDWRSLPSGLRLVVHVAVCAGLCAALFPDASWVLLAPLALTLGWMANLYNFMDGADGLAGGMAVCGFGAYAAAAALGGDAGLAWLCASVAAAAAAFLLSNFPPARIFMGDAGSVPLGFLAGALGLAGWLRGLWPWWFPAVVFAPFAVDASVTLLRRLLRRERVWEPHRTHYYQRIILMGWSHRRTALAEYFLMAACAVAALLALGRPPAVQVSLLAVPVLLIAGAMALVDRMWSRRRASP